MLIFSEIDFLLKKAIHLFITLFNTCKDNSIIMELTPSEIGMKLKKAGRLESQPLCVYGVDTPPSDSVQSIDINRCIANVIYSIAINSNVSSVHIGRDDQKRCCPGGQAWFGYQSFNPSLKYFLSTGSPAFRGGKSEFLISNPDLAEKRLSSTDKITPLDKFIVIRRSDSIKGKNQKIKAFLCFGRAEQIRNLCSLSYFSAETSYEVQMPWGPSCASFVSYPTGIIENSINNNVILGPTDPTGNHWFPNDFMSLGIPFQTAMSMAKDLNSSFIGKRPKIAYPDG